MDIHKSWLVTQMIAHRGLHNTQAPENTLAAFERAVQAGYPIELDVREIDDGTVVVIHDLKLSRLTGSDGYVTNLTRDNLKKYKIMKTEQTIPLFSEVLELVNGQVPILIEIKNVNKVGKLEKSIYEMLKAYEGEYAVQSFNPYSIEYFKHFAPSITRGQLSSFFINENSVSPIKKYVLKRMLFNHISRPDFISYDQTNLPNRYVSKYSHLPVLAWTIRSQAEYERVLPYCNNIIFENFIPAPKK